MKYTYFSLCLILLIGFTSCSKDDNNNSETVTKANIIGSVNLFDEGVTQIDNSNMIVSIEGTGFSATTDGSGDFKLTDVPFGTYTLVFEKAGYGTYKKFDIEHKNTGSSTVINNPSLGLMSTTAITNLTINSNSSFPVILTSITNPEASTVNPKYIRYFLSTDASVSDENYENAIETLQANNTPNNFNLSQAAIDALGYASGTRVYAKCYGESFWGNNYADPNLARDVFPNLNPTSAPAVSFVVP
ncbi:carboxypeptidase-like regulatory domain-containing protein [Algibacter mikhailovii]|uniref:Carboxypeptidase regulatory-like domain-containing protein n=1 Tax=Algibacter mikhailovii TaxID=425498 RepID=A0A918QTA0_9FLAO|nr:carboxypeptidase-like regulatory domain-containing protein [Algibacter mikhailovii]GGZ68365.1 hypothetical protein GCM10007028_01600 [Algibacter mikhailovii]